MDLRHLYAKLIVKQVAVLEDLLQEVRSLNKDYSSEKPQFEYKFRDVIVDKNDAIDKSCDFVQELDNTFSVYINDRYIKTNSIKEQKRVRFEANDLQVATDYFLSYIDNFYEQKKINSVNIYEGFYADQHPKIKQLLAK